MKNTYYKVVLFPVTEDKLSRRQKDHILRTINGITINDIEEYVSNRPDIEQIEKLCSEMKDMDRLSIFSEAKMVCDVEYVSYRQLEALSIIAELLEIPSDKTGFSFDIYSVEERLRYEYNRLLINYSIITSVISFVPFSFIKDLLFTTPLQVLMVNNISKLYDFKMDGKNFVHVVGGTAGVNIVFRAISSLLSLFIPFKWCVRASVSFASTYAIGVLAKVYVESNGEISEASLQDMFENAYEEGKIIYGQFKEYINKNRKKLVKDFKESFKTAE